MSPVDELEELEAIRPRRGDDLQHLVSAEERSVALRSILASPREVADQTGHRRRYAMPAALAAAAAVAVIVGSVAISSRSSHNPARSSAAGHHATVHAPRLLTVAYVTGRSREAIAGFTSGSMQVTVDRGDGTSEQYLYDLADGASLLTARDATGAVTSEESTTGTTATATRTFVDYAEQAWWSWTLDNEPAGATASGLDPASLREQLADGDLVKVGDEDINGQAAIHLRYASPVLTLGGQTVYTDATDLWVDATSFLPIREVGVSGAGDADPEADSWQSTFQWSHTPPSSVAAQIPAGFTHLPGPPQG